MARRGTSKQPVSPQAEGQAANRLRVQVWAVSLYAIQPIRVPSLPGVVVRLGESLALDLTPEDVCAVIVQGGVVCKCGPMLQTDINMTLANWLRPLMDEQQSAVVQGDGLIGPQPVTPMLQVVAASDPTR